MVLDREILFYIIYVYGDMLDIKIDEKLLYSMVIGFKKFII